MRFVRGTVALFLVGVASEALAAGGDAHGPNWFLLFLQVVNVAILVAVLLRFVRKPLHNFMVQRSNGIRRQIETAEQRLAEAQAEVDRLKRRLESFEEEARGLVADTSATAEAERQRLVERAHATSERIREEAETLADQEIARARRELRDEAATLATTLARELLRENLSADDDQRLVGEYIDKLGGSQ